MCETPSKELVKRSLETETLMSEIMGSVIVTIAVGPDKRIFTVHNDLLIASSGDLASYFTLQPDQDRAYPLPGVSADIFALFVDILYARRVPGVIPGSSDAAQAKRIRQLCQLYTFAEKSKLKHDILNMVMDAIQDGFRTFDRIPDYGLVQNIYKNTTVGSLLRKFCATCISYNFRHGGSQFVDNGALQTLMRNEPDFMDDFLYSLRIPIENLHKDPRVRNSVSEPALKGIIAAELVGRGGPGWWPCWFHVHSPEWTPYKMDEETGDLDETPFAKDCYLVN